MRRISRRTFLGSSFLAARAWGIGAGGTQASSANPQISLFDGATLDGWIDVENSATSFSSSDVADLAGLAKKLSEKSDPVSAYVSSQLDDSLRADLAAFASTITQPPSGTPADEKALASALVKNLNKLILGPLVYDRSRFQNIVLRPETQALLDQNPRGANLVHLNKLLLQNAFPSGLSRNESKGWEVKIGAIASTGAGRGVLYTERDFGRFRLTFTMRHVSGDPDHQACVLIFCTRPQPDEIPLDALGGIQFQVPKGGHWDYRPGHNNAGADFTTIFKPDFDPHQWSRVQIVADASSGTALMSVAQPIDAKLVDVLSFNNAAGKVGPIALQMHNAGLFDEYKDIAVEIGPT